MEIEPTGVITKELFFNFVSGYMNANNDYFPVEVTEKAWEEFCKQPPLRVSFSCVCKPKNPDN